MDLREQYKAETINNAFIRIYKDMDFNWFDCATDEYVKWLEEKVNRAEKLGYSERASDSGNSASGDGAGIEFRPDMDDIDEIVADNAGLHLEYMSDSSIWMSITIQGKEYHVHINPRNPKSQAQIKTWAEDVS